MERKSNGDQIIGNHFIVLFIRRLLNWLTDKLLGLEFRNVSNWIRASDNCHECYQDSMRVADELSLDPIGHSHTLSTKMTLIFLFA